MKTENGSLSGRSSNIQTLIAGDVCIPFLAAAIPAGIFRLMGFIAMGFHKPGMEPPIWIIVSMLALQVFGMISMAIVILVRFDHGSRKLMLLMDGQPHAWRKYTLFLSIASLFLFDLLSNISAAFAGAEFLLAGAAFAFIAYIAFNRLAFAGTGRPQQPSIS
ncbi:MAG: hypothetical protein KGQ60_13930 [Planctomycetes bacterium]|nr:hypothetical protein [Planctomycetota bacterium]